jgi:hypothetical protein
MLLSHLLLWYRDPRNLGNGNGELPWYSRLRCSSPGSMMLVERRGFRQWTGMASPLVSYPQLGQQLLLCLWIGRGQWKWRMEEMFVDRIPGSRGRGKVNPVLGGCGGGNGQCRMEHGTRKDIQCSLFEVLKHNERSSTM